MYTRDSDSRTIADEVMAEGTARGDTLLECNIKQRMYDFLAEHGSASTLDGWLTTADEYEHRASIQTMGFIITHSYLRELFPRDVLDEMACIATKEPGTASLVKYILEYSGLLPEEALADLPSTIPRVTLEAITIYGGADDLAGDL